jgi:membrane protein DedA with SNARE-associated domain
MDILDSYSYLGIVVLLILTGCGLPLPEELVYIAAGIAAAFGKLHWFLAFPACIVGALLGDLVMYGMGRMFGRGLTRRRGWLSRWLNEKTEARAEEMIRRHGLKVFLLGRFLVGVRAPMYVAAGVLRMRLARFLLVDGICATIVISLVFGLSYLLGWHLHSTYEEEQLKHDIHVWVKNSQVAVTFIVLGAAVAVGIYFFWVWRSRHTLPANGNGANSPEPAADSTPVSSETAGCSK